MEHSLPENGGRRWKTAVFPAFSTRKSGVPVLWKTQDFFFPIWRGTESSAGTNCKKKRKSFDFLLYKRQSAHFSSQKLAWIAGLHYGLYKQNQISLWKTRWKKWKTSWETGPFFTKSVENPVEKVKSSLRNGKIPPFFVVKWAGVRLHFAVTA